MEPATSSSVNPHRHPWALWELVLSVPRWLLHRGYPPELNDPQLSVRLLRMTIVTILLGILAAWAHPALRIVEGYSGLRNYVPDYIYVYIWGCYCGLPFGLIALVPLSRWQGRNWWWTVAAVPVSAVVYHPLFSSLTRWAVTQPTWVAAGMIGGFVVAFWMIPPVNRRALAFILLTVVAGAAGKYVGFHLNNPIGNFFQSLGGTWGFWYDTSALIYFLESANLYWPFNSLVAMVLGWELATNPRYRQ